MALVKDLTVLITFEIDPELLALLERVEAVLDQIDKDKGAD